MAVIDLPTVFRQISYIYHVKEHLCLGVLIYSGAGALARQRSAIAKEIW